MRSQGDSKRWRIALSAVVALVFGLGAYLIYLYGQLEAEFSAQNQFTPTKIYSDVTLIGLGHPKALVDQRLKALGYTAQREGLKDGQKNGSIRFELHERSYPSYLIPSDHLQAQVQAQAISDGGTLSAEIQITENQVSKIYLSTPGQDPPHELPSLFLEPEFISTLAQSTLSEGNSDSIRHYLRFEEIPSAIWKAIIAVEDQHFLDHKGFDPRGLLRALWINIKSLRYAQGGSTITQQLVKNLTGHKRRSIFRKINEIFLAILLEVKYGKEQILERYLNEVYLGQIGNLEIHGVAEGARYFFGKDIDELNLAETAILAGVIRGPAYYSPYKYPQRVTERQRWVLKKMLEAGLISQSEHQDALAMRLRFSPPPTAGSKAPAFTDYVKADLIRMLKDRMQEPEIIGSGFRVYTTLNPWLNAHAQDAVSQVTQELEKNQKITARIEGLLVSMDHETGAIRALIGGRNYGESTFNRVLNMRRQVGSTFKPFVYLAAILKGLDPKGAYYGPAHPALDAEWTLSYDRDRQKWTPKNYEKEFLGWISYKTALAKSVNTVAARLGYEIGLDAIIETGIKLGLNRETDLPKVPSLTLGVSELSAIDLLTAYGTIAARGMRPEPYVIRAITYESGSDYLRTSVQGTQTIDMGSAQVIAEMMRAVFSDGTAAIAQKMGWDKAQNGNLAFGKTGTTSNYRDAWFAGTHGDLTTVTWVGLDRDQSNVKIKLTGAGAALPIWVRYHLKAPPHTPPISTDLVEMRFDPHTGLKATSGCSDTQTVVERIPSQIVLENSSCESKYPEISNEYKEAHGE